MVSRHDKEIRIKLTQKDAQKTKREIAALNIEVKKLTIAQKKVALASAKVTLANKKAALATKKLAAANIKAGKAAGFMRIKTSGLRRTLGAIRNQLLIVIFAFGGLVHAMNKAIASYKRQWQAEQKLIAGLKNVAGSTKETTHALIRYAGALQKVTTFGDENIISGMAQLSTFQLNAAAIKEITPRMLDMAAAAQIVGAEELELHQIAISLGKGLTGDIGTLGRYGVKFDKMALAVAKAAGKTAEFNFILKSLDENFKGIALQLSLSTIGQIRQYEMAIGDASEKIGITILPLAKWAAGVKLMGIEFLSTLAIIKAGAGGWSFKGLGTMIEMWKEARKELKGLADIADLDFGRLRLTADQIVLLAQLNKQFIYSLELAKGKALIDDGIIDQREQLGLLDLQRIHLNNLLNQGLLEEIDYWTKITQLNNQMIVVTKKLNPEIQIQVDMIRQFGSAMAQAAIDGQNMGKAVTSAIKAIAAQILAELAIFALAKAFGLDLGLLMAGGGTITKFVGGVLGIGKSSSIVSTPAPVSAPVQTQIINQNTFLILDDQQGVELQLLLNRVSANA